MTDKTPSVTTNRYGTNAMTTTDRSSAKPNDSAPALSADAATVLAYCNFLRARREAPPVAILDDLWDADQCRDELNLAMSFLHSIGWRQSEPTQAVAAGQPPSASPQSAPEGIDANLKGLADLVDEFAGVLAAIADRTDLDSGDRDEIDEHTKALHEEIDHLRKEVAALTRARDEAIKDLAESRDREESIDEACDAMQAQRDAANRERDEARMERDAARDGLRDLCKRTANDEGRIASLTEWGTLNQRGRLAAEAEVARLSAAAHRYQGWIACAERMPTAEDHQVLVYVPAASLHGCDYREWIGCAWRDPDDGSWSCSLEREANVTHWMPLPTPPAGAPATTPEVTL